MTIITQKSKSKTPTNSTTLATMKEAKRWLLWGGAKVPHYPNGKRRSTTDTDFDRSQMGTYKEAQNALESNPKKYAGLGFALGVDEDSNHWQGIDLDHVEENELDTLSSQLPGYVETSPSGDGVHAIGYGKKFNSLGSNDTGIEAYSTGRYFTFTGNEVRDSPLTDLKQHVENVLSPIHGNADKDASTTSCCI